MKNYTLRNAKTVAKFAEKLGQWNGKKLAIELIKLTAQKVTVEFVGGLYLKAISEEVSAEEVKAIVSKYADRVELTSKELDRVAVSFADYLSKATYSEMFESPDFSALNDIRTLSVLITNHMYTTLLSTLWTKSLDFRQSELLRKEGFIFAAQLEALAQTEEATEETAQTEEATEETAQKGNTMNAENIFQQLTHDEQCQALLTIISEVIKAADMHTDRTNCFTYSAPELNANEVTAKILEQFAILNQYGPDSPVDKGYNEVDLYRGVKNSITFINEELDEFASKLTITEIVRRRNCAKLVAWPFYPIAETLADDVAPSMEEADYEKLYEKIELLSRLYLLPQADEIAEALA